jgi:hypothetical protein
MTFEKWVDSDPDAQFSYEALEFLMSEGALTADDIYMKLESAFEAGHDKALDNLVNDCTGTHTSYVEIHKEDVFERKIGK